MLVLCHANGDPVQVGDKVTLRSGEEGEVERLAPGHSVVLIQTPDGSAWLAIHHCGLVYLDRQASADVLTVHDHYVLALLPLLCRQCVTDLALDNAFALADKCMKRRK